MKVVAAPETKRLSTLIKESLLPKFKAPPCTYKPNGERERARRMRQIAAGSLKRENGLLIRSRKRVIIPRKVKV